MCFKALNSWLSGKYKKNTLCRYIYCIGQAIQLLAVIVDYFRLNWFKFCFYFLSKHENAFSKVARELRNMDMRSGPAFLFCFVS